MPNDIELATSILYAYIRWDRTPEKAPFVRHHVTELMKLAPPITRMIYVRIIQSLDARV